MRSLTAIVGVAILATSALANVNEKECFPIEKLPKELQMEAVQLLQKMLESEALLTLAGNIKPMSSGWLSFSFEVKEGATEKIEKYQQIFSALRCGNEIEAVLSPFTRVYERKRYVDGFVFNRYAYERAISEKPSVFQYFGITKNSAYPTVLGLIDGEGTPERSRAFGHLFGYPDHAVNFFVEAEESQKKTGEFVKRDFISIPIFEEKKNRFVYAVPVGHQQNEADRLLAERTQIIVQEFAKRRQLAKQDDPFWPLKLLRDWYRVGKDKYSVMATVPRK